MVVYKDMDVSISYDFRINKKTLYLESALEILIKANQLYHKEQGCRA